MVVGDDGSTLSLVRQVDHQVQCRDMAMAWGAPGFARLDHWDSVVRAAARHDDGWRAQDESPGVDGDGRPEDFPDVARDRHAAFYDEAIAAVCADDARAGLVCCLHGRGLYEKRLGLDGPIPGRRGRPAVERDFIARQLRRQRALQRALGPGADAWGADAFLLLQAWDALSLYLVWTGLRRGEPWRLARVPRGPGAGEATLSVSTVDAVTAAVDPWPFATDAVDVPVDVVTVPARPYPSSAALSRQIAATRPHRVGYRLVAGSSASEGRRPPRHA